MSKRTTTGNISLPILGDEDLQRIQKVISAAPSDAKTASEIHDLAMARKRAELDDFINDIGARRLYAGLIFVLLVLWLGAIIWIVIATGSGW